MVSQRVLAVARGDEPADLVLAGGLIVNVFTGEVEEGDIAVCDGLIAGVGGRYEGRGRIELSRSFVGPGLIDAHVHIESSLCVPAEFARAVLPRGVTTVVADPHEIANVAGVSGVEWMARASARLPLGVVMMAPSCVPASPLARGGAEIDAAALLQLRRSGAVYGLAEVMNFPGIIAGDEPLRDKLAAMVGMPIDGHCPGVRGKMLNAYVAAGIGSDHESVTADEAREKLARGMYLLIREATNARNLEALLPAVTPKNSRRVCFCTDDRTPGDLLRQGSVDYMVRRAIELGIAPIEAIRMASLNTAEWFGLSAVGAIAPGRAANLVVFDDLQRPEARMVFVSGELVAQDGKMLPDVDLGTDDDDEAAPALGACTVDWPRVSLSIPATGQRIRVIGTRPDQLVTDSLMMNAHVVSGLAEADVTRDLLKMAVIGRHGVHSVGLGFIQGFGLRRGALAGTIAHDHHNLVIIGCDDASMLAAGQAVTAMGGGLAVADGKAVIAQLTLDVGGLMSTRPVEQVAAGYDAVVAAACRLGSTLADPFMAMSFMALEVIPSLKLTEQGLVDVERFARVALFV